MIIDDNGTVPAASALLCSVLCKLSIRGLRDASQMESWMVDYGWLVLPKSHAKSHAQDGVLGTGTKMYILRGTGNMEPSRVHPKPSVSICNTTSVCGSASLRDESCTAAFSMDLQTCEYGVLPP